MSTPRYGTKVHLTINLTRECLRCRRVDSVRDVEWTPNSLGNAYDAAVTEMDGDFSHCANCLGAEEKEEALFATVPTARLTPPEHVSDEDVAWQQDQRRPRAHRRAYGPPRQRQRQGVIF